MPKHWKGFKATRKFRGVTYHIEVHRKGDGNAVALCVDGAEVKGNVVPVPIDGRKQVAVRAVLS
jgi:cellobiose phosphorylase